MNNFKIAKIIIVFSSVSYLSVSFLRNYNSPENIEKRCIFRFEKDLKNNLETSHEEWNKILDLADYNYLKCMEYLSINYGRGKEKKKFRYSP